MCSEEHRIRTNAIFRLNYKEISLICLVCGREWSASRHRLFPRSTSKKTKRAEVFWTQAKAGARRESPPSGAGESNLRDLRTSTLVLEYTRRSRPPTRSNPPKSPQNPLPKNIISWQGGRGSYVQMPSKIHHEPSCHPVRPAKFIRPEPLSPCGSSFFPQISTFFRPSLPPNPLSPRSPFPVPRSPFPVPRPANDATREKQIPFSL